MSDEKNSLNSFYNYSESRYAQMKESEEEEVIFHFVGDLNSGYANAISTKLEQLVEENVSDKQAQKRFYTVYIEAIQNIRLHALRLNDDETLGTVTVSVNGSKICGQFLNMIPASRGEALKKKYTEINLLDRKDLKKKYMDQMMHGDISKKGGAGLGIITIVLRSQNPSEVAVIPIDSKRAIFQSVICVDYCDCSK